MGGRVSDGDGVPAHTNGVRRLADAEDLPAAVRELLRVHLLHRVLQGQVHRVAEAVQQDLRQPAGRMRPRRLPAGALHPAGHHHGRQAGHEHDPRDAVPALLQVDEHAQGQGRPAEDAEQLPGLEAAVGQGLQARRMGA